MKTTKSQEIQQPFLQNCRNNRKQNTLPKAKNQFCDNLKIKYKKNTDKKILFHLK